MSQYRDSRLGLASLTVDVTGATDFPVTFQRLRLSDSCGRHAVYDDGAENDGYSTTQEYFYSYPIFLLQPTLAAGLYFLLLAPVECPCAVRIHGLVVGTQPGGDPWPVTGLEGHSNRCRHGAAIRSYGPAVIGAPPAGADGKPGDPATIAFSRAVTGGPSANEEQLVTFGPGNFFGGGFAIIGNSLFQVQVGSGDGGAFVPPGDLITPSNNAGVRITRETAGFRIGYAGAHGNQAIALPTVAAGVNASTLRSTTVNGIATSTGAPDDFSEGYLYVTGGFGSPLEIPLGIAAGCTGNLGGTLTNPDGATALTLVAS